MVVRDNDTRWNSSYTMIHRALKLRLRLDTLLMKFADDFEDDTLSEDDWDQLKDLESILKPFQEVTKRLEGRATCSLLWIYVGGCSSSRVANQASRCYEKDLHYQIPSQTRCLPQYCLGEAR